MLQTCLELIHANPHQDVDFIVTASNLDAKNAMDNHFSWPDARLMVLGEGDSGKTQLANYWHYKAQARGIKTLLEMQRLYKGYSCFYIDDFELLDDEEDLFHIINFAKNNSLTLLLLGGYLPSYELKDLQSRLNATKKILIKGPDESLFRVILLKQFSQKQLRISESVIDFIVTRAERSFSSINYLVEKIDNESLGRKRNITVPLVKEVMVSIGMLENESATF